MAAFTPEEYRRRVDAVAGVMEAAGIETLVILSEPHMCYLTGYEGRSDYVPQAAVLRAGDRDARLILREMDIHCAYPTVYLDETLIESYPEDCIGTDARSPWDVIGARVLEIAGDGAIGIEYGASTFSYSDHQALTAVLGDREMIDATRIVPQVTIRKSDAEIETMKQGGAIVDRALMNGIAMIAPGVRQCDVAARITHDLIEGTPECGGDAPKPVTMPTGPGIAQAPHLKWTDVPYRPNDQTNFEIGAFVHRYCTALCRTVHLGEPPQRLRRVHDAVIEGFESAFDAICPGATCADVHGAFTSTFAKSGVRKESRIGYSLGIDWGDLCFSLQADDRTVLDTNYTMHLIIGIWERDDTCIFSESVRVGETGAESLTNVPRELFTV